MHGRVSHAHAHGVGLGRRGTATPSAIAAAVAPRRSPVRFSRTAVEMAKKVLALFDVDGTLTVPRKVCRLHALEGLGAVDRCPSITAALCGRSRGCLSDPLSINDVQFKVWFCG
eukprot:323293-Chlamydomonas_euryale.AAC.2